MGGFGPGRHSGVVTAEGTASYVIAIRSLAFFLQRAQCLTGTIHFDEGKFPIVITVDTSDPSDACEGSGANSAVRSATLTCCWLRSAMGKPKTVEELFKGRHFDREVVILCVLVSSI
jgi:hypothetical protein